MVARVLVLMALTFAVLAPARAAPPTLPEEIVLTGDNIIDVLLNGVPVRLEVSAEAFGPPIINPDLAAQLQLMATRQRGWQFGPVQIWGIGGIQMVDFGAGPVPIAITWADRPASIRADGVIGVHDLPHSRVTFALAAPDEAETVQRFVLKRAGGSVNTRLGTEVRVGKRKLMMVFVPERADNLITAPTANFIATHHEGGFVPGSDAVAILGFAIARPTRMMRIAQPVTLGDLAVDQFAVRVEDYGEPSRVGEIGENDPRFQKGQILVSRRKGRGRPDLLTRLGRDQIAHCSTLTYDLELSEIRLSCVARAE